MPDAAIADQLAEAKRIVEAYLERSMVPDPEGARKYLSPDYTVTFTGGRRFSGPEDTAAFNAKRYAWVKKRFIRSDACHDPETGEIVVYNTGHLYGAWPDGEEFDGNRYLDRFVIRDGLIVSSDVWNDSAERRLAKAGLAEAPL